MCLFQETRSGCWQRLVLRQLHFSKLSWSKSQSLYFDKKHANFICDLL
jgi:hypothetical protein